VPEVIRSLEIQAPPSAVWRWFESQEALRRWFSPNLEIDLTLGGSFRTMGGDERSLVSGTVLELVPEGRLVLSWFEEDAGWVHPARLAIELTATPVGTKVTLVHDGFAGIGKPGWEQTVEGYERGADRHQLLEKLAAVVASGA
jgi:uncharacterized protein YndB with AHSA1/START domain